MQNQRYIVRRCRACAYGGLPERANGLDCLPLGYLLGTRDGFLRRRVDDGCPEIEHDIDYEKKVHQHLENPQSSLGMDVKPWVIETKVVGY